MLLTTRSQTGHQSPESQTTTLIPSSPLLIYPNTISTGKKRPNRTLSEFQIRLAKFTDEIAKIGTIVKLRRLTNGEWLNPLDCAQEAVNAAGNNEFHLSI